MRDRCHYNILCYFILGFYLFTIIWINNAIAAEHEDAVNLKAQLAWAEPVGEDYAIFYSCLRNNLWSPKVQLSNLNFTNLFPSISSGVDGITWVVWTGLSGSKSYLFYCNFDGNSWSNPKKILTNLSSNTSSSIIVDNDNIPWVVWAGFDGQDDDIWFTRLNGDDWDEPQRVNKDDSMPDILPVIGIDEEGNHWVKWSGYDGEGYRNYSCKWTGTEWGDEKGADRNNTYNSMIKNEVDSIPDLPDFLYDTDKASIHIKDGAQIQSIPLRHLTDMSIISEDSSMYLNQTNEYSKQASSQTIIIGFGDSITQGSPYITEPGNGQRVGGYEPKLEALLSNTQVLNYGVGGERTNSGVDRIDDVLIVNNAEYILIMEGTNDIWGGLSYQTTVYNLGIMIDKIRAQSIIPILANLTPDIRHDNIKQIPTTYNPVIENLAIKKVVSLCDQYNAMVANWSSLSDDGLHPNDDGYQLMAETWAKSIPKKKSSGGGGCFVATAAFGSSLEPHVMTLKDFRDQYLLTNRWGREFVEFYYKISPQIADIIADYKPLKLIVRTSIYPIVGYSYIMLNSSAGEKIALFCFFILIMICFGVLWLRLDGKVRFITKRITTFSIDRRLKT